MMFAAAMAGWATAPPASAQEMVVDLELVLAVDVSGSVDSYEARQQREGYLSALTHPDVIQAIRANQYGQIAVSYIEWAGVGVQRTVVDWRLIDGEKSAAAFVEELAANPPYRARWTSISGAIDYAVPMFDNNGFTGTRRVIDVSGDGSNNSGRPVQDARDEAVARGIVINGVPILNDRPQPFDMPTPIEIRLDYYYLDWVIGGPGSFIVTAESFEDFRTAILSKLIREIARPGSRPPTDTLGQVEGGTSRAGMQPPPG